MLISPLKVRVTCSLFPEQNRRTAKSSSLPITIPPMCRGRPMITSTAFDIFNMYDVLHRGLSMITPNTQKRQEMVSE